VFIKYKAKIASRMSGAEWQVVYSDTLSPVSRNKQTGTGRYDQDDCVGEFDWIKIMWMKKKQKVVCHWHKHNGLN